MKENNYADKSLQSQLENMDGVVAAPKHHTLIFENEEIRIVRFRVEPGDTVPLHTHRFATVNYVVRVSDFISFDGDGNLKHDSRTGNTKQKAGEIFELPAFPPLHSVKNVGSEELYGITVELKKAPGRRFVNGRENHTTLTPAAVSSELELG